jgi:predicted GNAT family acetyltransferase
VRVQVTRYADGAQLLERAEALLIANEAENNLMIAICGGPAQADAYWATVDDGGRPVAAAVWTPPQRLVLSAADPHALEVLLADLRARAIAPPGVMGPSAAAQAFAESYDPRAPVVMRQRIFRLDALVEPASAPGAARAPGADDLPVIASFIGGFNRDAHLHAVDDEVANLRDAERVCRAGGLMLWVAPDGRAAAMANVTGHTRRGVRVNYVYTPPELRGRGYASACVAEVSRRQLERGRFCCLYTDLANPTSNRIYQRLGYRPVSDSLVFDFSHEPR